MMAKWIVVCFLLCPAAVVFVSSLDESYRLPKVIEALRYTLHFNYTPNEPLQTGRLILEFVAVEKTKDVVLHSANLFYYNEGDVSCPDSGNRSLPYPMADADQETITFRLESPIQEGEVCRLSLPFGWNLNFGENRGAFFESYNTFLLLTKFQPVFARQMFPCLDEPAFKATFQINLYISKALNSQVLVKSNMPLSRSPQPHSKDLVAYEFMDSPKMSTYLVSIIMANSSIPFSGTENLNRPKVEALGFVDPEHLYKTAHLIQQTTKLLQTQLGIENPLDKVTYAKVGRYPSGATEHWGLIISRSLDTMVTVHETIHQWFGNMVTCDWWTDIWLNEGITNYYNCKVMDDLRQLGWNVYTSNQCYRKWRLLSEDESMKSDITLTDTRNYPKFKIYSYAMGPSFLRMVESLIGRELMESGLRKYLRQHAYETVKTHHFVSVIADTAHKNHSKMANWKSRDPIDMRKFLNSWIYQGHMPNITIKYDYARGEFNLRQTCSKWGCRNLWYIPIRNYNPKYRLYSAFFWLTPKTPEIRIKTRQQDVVWNPGKETYANIINAPF